MNKSQKQPSESERSLRRSRGKIVAGLVVIFGLVIMWSMSSSEPSYQGRRLSEWLKGFDKPFETTFIVSFQDMPVDALEAVRHMGVDSLPTLLEQIQARDSIVVQKLYDLWERQSVIKFRPTPAIVKQRRASIALAALGPKALQALPRLEKLLQDENTLRPASLAIAYLGHDGVKVLTNALSNPNPVVRRECLTALSNVQTGGEVAIPILISSLRDPDPVVQGRAALALAVIRDEPWLAIPALTELVAKTNAARLEAIIALGQYGPMATSAIPQFLDCLLASDSMTRSSARTALKRIGAETNAIIAAVTNALTNADINLRLFAINTLASLGQAASNAAPMLAICWNDPASMVHNAASNALANIDAQLLGRLTKTNPISLR
jgi:HEAT repeat protein